MKSLKLALFLVLIPLTFISAQSVELVENEPVRPIQHQYNPGKFNAQGELIEKGEISDIVDRACAEAEVALQYIESDEHIPQGQRNFKNTIEALEHVLAQFRWAV